MTPRFVKSLVLVPAVALAACGRSDSKPMDDALRNDLSLAAQVQPNQPQQFVSPTEMGYGQPGYAPGMNAYAPGYGPQPYRAPAPAPATRTVYRTRRVYSGGSSGGGYSAPAPTRVVKNTKRDAIIGAVGGAAIGAVTSRNKVKGAVIGGVAGGILGAVIGNNVDKHKEPY